MAHPAAPAGGKNVIPVEPGEGSRVYRLLVLGEAKSLSAPHIRSGGLWIDERGGKKPMTWAEFIGQEGELAHFIRRGDVKAVQVFVITDAHPYPVIGKTQSQEGRA